MARVFPKTGVPAEDLLAKMDAVRESDPKWREGRMISSVYFVSDELMDLTREAYGSFILENALYSGEHARRRKVGFATLTMFEEEVIAMALEILNGPEGAGGNTTSGGTESIMLAVKAARDWAREHRRVPGTPELVVPRTAHPAFNKAAAYMDLEVKRVPQGPDYRADVAAMDAAVSDNTILMAGSAPAYPFGVIDPITELAEVAKNRGVWFHVDACVGGYQANFARKLGYPVPVYDLGVDGVWSISADLHKYGFTAKGMSTILYREAALKDFATFTFDDWPYGTCSTPTVGGSRTGGAQAAAWAVMKYLGEKGYLDAVRTIMETRARLMDGVEDIDGLTVRGKPHIGLMSIGSDEYDVHAVADAMLARGWITGRGKEPNSIHLTLSPVHAAIHNSFLSDLASAAAAVRSGQFTGSGEGAVYVG